MDADGSHIRVISNDALSLQAFDPSSPDDFLSVSGLIAWSPDGSQLVAEIGVGLYLLVNADGTHARVFNALFPVWSPDGRYLASYTSISNAASQNPSSEYTIALLDTQTFKTRLLDGLPGLNAEGLAWSPDGRYLAMTAQVNGPFQLVDAVVRVRPDGTGIKVLDQLQSGQVQQLFWSPDSQKLAVAVQSFGGDQQGGQPDNGASLLVINADGSHLHQVGFSDGGQPSWSPDGKHLIYTSPDGTALAIVDASSQPTSRPRSLSAALDFLFAPCWSPLAGI